MDTLSVRFLKAYDYLKNNSLVTGQRDFAAKIGVSTSMITEIVKGRSNVGASALQNIVIAFDEFNADWILTGKGEMLKTEETKSPPTNQIEIHSNDPLVNRLFDTIEKKDLKIEELLKENARLGEQLRLIDAKKTDTGNIAGSVSTKSNLSRISQRATSAGVHLKE
jgi:transcriptional regulator with XRE-family HTH domain